MQALSHVHHDPFLVGLARSISQTPTNKSAHRRFPAVEMFGDNDGPLKLTVRARRHEPREHPESEQGPRNGAARYRSSSQGGRRTCDNRGQPCGSTPVGSRV